MNGGSIGSPVAACGSNVAGSFPEEDKGEISSSSAISQCCESCSRSSSSRWGFLQLQSCCSRPKSKRNVAKATEASLDLPCL